MIATAFSTASANYSCPTCVDVRTMPVGNTNPTMQKTFANLWMGAFNSLSTNTWGSNTTATLGTRPNVVLTIDTNNNKPGAGALRPCQ